MHAVNMCTCTRLQVRELEQLEAGQEAALAQQQEQAAALQQQGRDSSESRAARTLAYDLIEQLVCAHADAVRGDTTSEVVRAVCRWRAAPGSGRRASAPTAADDVCAAVQREALIQRQQALLEGAGLV